LVPPPPPSEPQQSSESATRRLAAIALPAVEAGVQETSLESMSLGDTITPASAGEGRGGGGWLGGLVRSTTAEYAGVAVAGQPGSVPPAAPIPSRTSPATGLDLKREKFQAGNAPDDGVQSKGVEASLGVRVTNVASASALSVGDPTWRNLAELGVATGAEPESLDRLADLSANASRHINGVADGFYRMRSPEPRAAGAKESQEAEKLKQLADVDSAFAIKPTSNATLYFDSEPKLFAYDLPSEAAQRKDTKPRLVQQDFAEGDVTLNKRFKIVLPDSERGEAMEKLQVASGPITVSEINYNEPATGLPAQKQSDTDVAREESLRRQAGQRPARQVTSIDEIAKLDEQYKSTARTAESQARKQINPQPEKPPKEESSGLAALSQELDNLRSVRDQVTARVLPEKTDAAISRSGVVEIIDAAEPEPVKKPTLWERVRGVVGGDVERSARISVQKDAPAIAGLAGTQTYNRFDPYWTQTESEKIQSKAILGKVVEQLNLNEAWAKTHGGGDKLQTEETLKLLKKKIEVRSDPKTGLIDIRAKSESPEEAARIANTVAQVYRDSRLEQREQMALLGRQALEEELVKQDREIARVEQLLESRKRELNREQVDEPLPKLAAGAPIPQPEVTTTDNAFSTFSLNVSDVSFKLAAASLEKGQMPDPATVRSEEFINAFDYRDPEPKGSAPIAFAWERARYPFAHNRDLVRFSIKTAASGRQPGRPLNLVLLLDNSGSMERADRIRIRQECLRVLAGQLQPQDRVSVVAFARTARLFVDGLPGSQAGELQQRVGGLAPEGGTNLEDAMNVAYRTALRHFLANGVNRVVLLTDGAANLGDVEPESLKKKVEAHRRQGVALDCFGIGWDGLNDELLEALSRNGDGRYGFVNTPEAARSEFAGQLAGALKVAASDVKVQVEWNPRRVTAYRQIGYAKHQLKKEQFRDNTVDAAEIGAAEAGNALYTVQVNPRGEGPLGTMRVRFKVPGTSDYREHEWTLPYEGAAKPLDQSSPALRLAASASAFSEWLVSSPFAAEVTPDKLLAQINGVPATWPADPRPKKLEWMIRQARSVAGK
jgi:Mg-chelatase subunit ChlD